jgi:reactive intermediate/imine deaminase
MTRLDRVNPDGVAPPAAGGYSHAVRVPIGDATLLFISGQLPLDASGVLVGAGDMAAQARQVFENLRTILEANGARFADVVRMGTFVTDLGDLATVRGIRREYLGSDPPASTLVQVRALVHPDAMIEVDLEAIVGPSSDRGAAEPVSREPRATA